MILTFWIFQIPFVFVHALVMWRAGSPVEEVSIGFGPRLFAGPVGNVIFKLNLIPLGSYVRCQEVDAPSLWRRIHLGLVPVAIIFGGLYFALGDAPFLPEMSGLQAFGAFFMPFTAAHDSLQRGLMEICVRDPAGAVLRLMLGMLIVNTPERLLGIPRKQLTTTLALLVSLWMVVSIVLLLF